MRNLEKLKTTKDKVRTILLERPDSRDNDGKLVALYWYYEDRPYFDGGGNSALDFLRALSDGKFSSAESIRRCRQKLQELEPNTRGPGYKEKKTTIEREVKSNINKL
jgi:hypothetical protein